MEYYYSEKRPHLADAKAMDAYLEKIKKEMQEVSEKIQEISNNPYNEEDTWVTVGDLRYGHPATQLILRLRALTWMHDNPPDPRGERMYKRVGPYTIFVRREDFAEIIPCDVRTVDRMLAYVRAESGIKPYGKITVELFCHLHNLPEDKIQQQLYDLAENRRKKH
jgi:hypothetical protein